MTEANGPGQLPRPARDRPWLMRTYAGHAWYAGLDLPPAGKPPSQIRGRIALVRLD
jgi:hypothetical protein